MTFLKLSDKMITVSTDPQTSGDRISGIARALFARRRAADHARWALMKIESDLETILETLEDVAEDGALFSELPQVGRHVARVRDRVTKIQEQTAVMIRKMATIMEG